MQRLVPILSLAALTTLTSAATAHWSTMDLSEARQGAVAVTAGDLAIFAGGIVPNMPNFPSATVDIYDNATDTWSTTGLSVGRHGFAGTVVGDLVLFAGGATSASTDTAVVDVYDAQNKVWLSAATLSQARHGLAATTVGSKAIFAGGATGGQISPSPSARVDIYDASKGLPSEQIAWSTTTLTEARRFLTAATAGEHALFAGGADLVAASATVDIYDDTTGNWSTASLSEARTLQGKASATSGTRAYFGGGNIGNGSTMSAVVDIYDAQTGLWSSTTLSAPRAGLAATALCDKVLFAGGLGSGPDFERFAVVDVWLVDTASWGPPMLLADGRSGLTATTVGGKALFAGGNIAAGTHTTLVDVYRPAGITYCTAKPGLVCGLPTIGSSGCPSASASAGFNIHAGPARGQKAGLLLYNNNGRGAFPFQGGTLCIQPSGLSRSVSIDSGGTNGLCDGVFALDMNCFASGACGGNPEAFLTLVGERINCQFWGRDSVATGSFLSDGLEYDVTP